MLHIEVVLQHDIKLFKFEFLKLLLYSKICMLLVSNYRFILYDFLNLYQYIIRCISVTIYENIFYWTMIIFCENESFTPFMVQGSKK